MPNAMESAAAWHGSQLKSHAGRAVSLEFGGETYPGLTAWCGMQDYDVPDEEGFATQVRSYDWRMVKADIPEGVTLRAGVVVVDTTSGHRYEVMPIGSKPAVEDADSGGLQTRMHTKRIA